MIVLRENPVMPVSDYPIVLQPAGKYHVLVGAETLCGLDPEFMLPMDDLAVGEREPPRFARCVRCWTQVWTLPAPEAPGQFGRVYRAAAEGQGARFCPLEAGVIGWLADNECPHGFLPSDAEPTCKCHNRRRAA